MSRRPNSRYSTPQELLTSSVIEMSNVQLEIVESMKLMGDIITSDMKWIDNTDYINKKGYSRLKKFGLPRDDLLDIYMKK